MMEFPYLLIDGQKNFESIATCNQVSKHVFCLRRLTIQKQL